ncbi:MAG: hypothetical protein HZA48_01310 [Planctomycetes bacterium]|nr:hypothetical protein [Planctomycetota bacterium]
MILPEIYQMLKEKEIFVTSDAVAIVKNYGLTAVQLNHLVKKGVFAKGTPRDFCDCAN